MRCQCGSTRTIVLDKHFRTALVCPKCDEIELAKPVEPEQAAVTAR